jgi:hypothetical protein
LEGVRGGVLLLEFEVKWTEPPSATDARHLLAFVQEHPEQAARGYIICRCSRPMEVGDKLTALPWFCL